MSGRREVIKAEITDVVTDLLNDDRKEDEELPRGAIEEAVEAGELTVADMVEWFAQALRDALEDEEPQEGVTVAWDPKQDRTGGLP